ncbi:hypothetical protein LDENG_00096440 [Lucifuga dentata]|nr:hypothetical protein LDENG_00096440 [Lucifuga dentata]
MTNRRTTPHVGPQAVGLGSAGLILASHLGRLRSLSSLSLSNCRRDECVCACVCVCVCCLNLTARLGCLSKEKLSSQFSALLVLSLSTVTKRAVQPGARIYSDSPVTGALHSTAWVHSK